LETAKRNATRAVRVESRRSRRTERRTIFICPKNENSGKRGGGGHSKSSKKKGDEEGKKKKGICWGEEDTGVGPKNGRRPGHAPLSLDVSDRHQ